MNISQLIELNAFKEAVSQKKSENAKFEILDFASIKNAENMDVKDLLEAGKNLVLIGLWDERFGPRPLSVICTMARNIRSTRQSPFSR